MDILGWCDRVCDFLVSCGGPYANGVSDEVRFNIGFAYGSELYVMKEKDGRILYFVSWWLVKPNDVESVKQHVRPIDITTGNVVYITDMGNTIGKRGMAEIIKELRRRNPHAKGVFWHRPAKGNKVCDYPSQKGKEV